MAGAVEGELFVGNKAQELRGLLKIQYPMTHGVVNHWDDMEKIWQHIYSEELKILSEEVRIFSWTLPDWIQITVASCAAYGSASESSSES